MGDSSRGAGRGYTHSEGGVLVEQEGTNTALSLLTKHKAKDRRGKGVAYL